MCIEAVLRIAKSNAIDHNVRNPRAERKLRDIMGVNDRTNEWRF
ncbi:MAG TPA: hypothetical protein VMU24_04415 [Candidatus Acidoferrales bacterium]|nr:hypothetical protein [Candidatus Acidoferrales bacterium]